MKHITGQDITLDRPTAVTLGNFDGLHRGHRELIKITKEQAKNNGLTSVVCSFLPHPMFLFKNRENTALIMSPYEKKYSMEGMGVDIYIEYTFDKEFASIEPEAFAEEIIFRKLNCKILVVGQDYHFGKKHSGNTVLLKKLAEKHGIKLILVPPVMFGGERVSSTRVRQYLIERDIENANNLLSSPYFIIGEVQHGKKLGRSIGFPTINIVADDVKLFPPNGVYATKTEYNGILYSSVTNIGINPTVNGKTKIIETYIFDFQDNVYGETLKVYFYKWIRDERKFPSVDALRLQLENDKKAAKNYFGLLY